MVTIIIKLLVSISLWRYGRPRIIDRTGKRPYIVRYYLIGCDPETGKGSKEPRWYDRWFTELFLQHFQRSDDTHQLHNHPWRWGASVILRGGYIEERRAACPWRYLTLNGVSREFYRIASRHVRWYNFLQHATFHRVDLYAGETWTLFLAGPKIQDWGFWDRSTGKYTPHEHMEDDDESREDENDAGPPPGRGPFHGAA